MDALTTRRLLRRSNRAFAGGLGLLMAVGMTTATADQARERFRIHATISPATIRQSNAGLGVSARLSPAQHRLIGGGYALSANALASASVCTGDTIFANGFDP